MERSTVDRSIEHAELHRLDVKDLSDYFVDFLDVRSEHPAGHERVYLSEFSAFLEELGFRAAPTDLRGVWVAAEAVKLIESADDKESRGKYFKVTSYGFDRLLRMHGDERSRLDLVRSICRRAESH